MKVRYLTREVAPTGCLQVPETIQFLAANGLAAHTIPAQGSLRIVDGDTKIEYREFDGPGKLTDWKEVPLRSAPWKHGVASYAKETDDER